MNRLLPCALAFCLAAGSASAAGLSISVDTNDSGTTIAPRRKAREARMVVRTRDRSAVLLLLDDAVAVQLSDETMKKLDSEKKDDAGFLEEVLVATMKVAVGKSVEYPIAKLRGAEFRDGMLRLTGDGNKLVFSEIKVNGTDVLRDLDPADAQRFVAAVRARKAAR